MTMHGDWEADLAGFLNELSAVQGELLELLSAKRSLLAMADLEGLAALGAREQELTERLESCHERRTELVREAQDQGLEGDSLQSLHAAMPSRQAALEKNVRQAAARSRLLQQESLANWVLTQRTLLYLSQLLELIGTGGRTRPTYSKEESGGARGALVDRAA
jgi:hypothetical protein